MIKQVSLFSPVSQLDGAFLNLEVFLKYVIKKTVGLL